MICNYCKSTKLEYLLSDTNSTYSYCKCDFDLACKHVAIDAVLKRLLNFLNTSKEGYLKIEVKQENGLLLLIINDIRIFDVDFKYDFFNKDVYYLENVIFELVQDFYDLSNVDIIVCE